MFSKIRRRFTYANVVVTLALVFAMSGGAYAAGRYLITSTKQLSPKVLKQLQGKAGPTGAQGQTGVAGAQGPAGPAGAPGKEGSAGKEGAQGKPGENGKNGKEGSPWTAGGTLPEGETLKGEWSLIAQAAGGLSLTGNSVSFALPLGKAPVKHYIKVGEDPPAGCIGNYEEPGAVEGNLCVFAREEENTEPELSGIPLPIVFGFEGAGEDGPTGSKADRFGFGMETFSHEAGPVRLEGTWAVTAE